MYGTNSDFIDPSILAYTDLLTYAISQNPQYIIGNHHRIMAEELMRVERGETTRLIITMPPRHGKPIEKSQLIQMVSGELIPLSNVNIGDFVISHTGKPRKVTNIFEQGELDCVKITMFSGRETIAAYDHPYFTTEGYVNAIDLDGHVCAIPDNIQCIDTATETIDEFKLTAYLLADGGLTSSTIRFTKSDSRILDDFISIASNFEFYSSKKISKNGNYHNVYLNSKCIEWCKKKKIHGKKSVDKTIPEYIFRGSKEKIRAFIGAYFSCDRSVNQKGKQREDCCIEIYSSSKRLLEQMRHLCARVGIEVIVRHKKAKNKQKDGTYKHFDAWRLSISNSENAYIFKNTIPITGDKKDKLEKWNVRKKLFPCGYLYDQVVSVEKIGKRECRCLEVEEDHTFLVNDLVVHNSNLASEMFPAWYLGRNPKHQIIFATYSGDKSVDVGRKVRNQLTDPVFADIFHSCMISPDAKAATNFTTTEGGVYVATGIGGVITGRGAHCVDGDAYITTDIGRIQLKYLYEINPFSRPKILTFNHELNCFEWSKIIAVSKTYSNESYCINTSKENSLETTGNHEFFLFNKDKYSMISNMVDSDSVLSCSYHSNNIFQSHQDDVLCIVKNKFEYQKAYYDVQTESDNHNFFANNILVHNCLLIDDPIKGRSEAESPAIRRKIIDWFGSVAYTRLMPGKSSIIIIMTRWHYDDLVGYALEELGHEGWRVIDMPAIAEKDELFMFDNGETWKRSEGEALWPECFPIDNLLTIKRTLHSRDWASLYQQRPMPDQGGMVNLEWFNGEDYEKRFDPKLLPRFEYMYFSADTAFKDKAINDPSSILVFGEYKGKFYLVEVVNERMQYPVLKEKCFELYNKYRHMATGGIKAFLIEDKASGQSLIQDIKASRNIHMPVIPVTPELNKTLRLDECTGYLEGGYVKLPIRAQWLSDFEMQLTRFPYDKHDDMVDALSQFLRWKFKARKMKKRSNMRQRFWK